jgi:hypothetical protein
VDTAGEGSAEDDLWSHVALHSNNSSTAEAPLPGTVWLTRDVRIPCNTQQCPENGKTVDRQPR